MKWTEEERKEGRDTWIKERVNGDRVGERASEWEIKGINEWVVFFDFNLHNYGSNDAR